MPPMRVGGSVFPLKERAGCQILLVRSGDGELDVLALATAQSHLAIAPIIRLIREQHSLRQPSHQTMAVV